jgi:hypothetical protein
MFSPATDTLAAGIFIAESSRSPLSNLRIVAGLPGQMPERELSPPETDGRLRAKNRRDIQLAVVAGKLQVLLVRHEVGISLDDVRSFPIDWKIAWKTVPESLAL